MLPRRQGLEELALTVCRPAAVAVLKASAFGVPAQGCSVGLGRGRSEGKSMYTFKAYSLRCRFIICHYYYYFIIIYIYDLSYIHSELV